MGVPAAHLRAAAASWAEACGCGPKRGAPAPAPAGAGVRARAHAPQPEGPGRGGGAVTGMRMQMRTYPHIGRPACCYPKGPAPDRCGRLQLALALAAGLRELLQIPGYRWPSS